MKMPCYSEAKLGEHSGLQNEGEVPEVSLAGIKEVAVKESNIVLFFFVHLDILYYEQLKSNVILHDLLVDSLIYKDVKLTASNDDYYFVFEDYLYQNKCLAAILAKLTTP
uniref:Uncharacterized protein n=1 Tax=Sphaerodactylus townsendi TaxID=933632 RepID=A0ACB8E6Z9_9SAUR